MISILTKTPALVRHPYANALLFVARCTSILLLLVWSYSNFYAANFDYGKFSSLASSRYGSNAFKTTTELNQLVNSLKSAPDSEKLQKINDFFNQHIRFVDDIDLWGVSDYWATPLETIGQQGGDCEDFSIAKYIFLKVLNIPDEKLRLTYVRANLAALGVNEVRAHMVLSYYPTPQSEPVILDNLMPEILPASQRKDLTPIFTFNSTGLWLGTNSSSPKSSSTSHLSRWRDVLLRIKADGIEY